MNENLTKMGYDNIIERIVNRTIDLPDDVTTANELLIWINAYAACQHDIVELIQALRDEYGR